MSERATPQKRAAPAEHDAERKRPAPKSGAKDQAGDLQALHAAGLLRPQLRVGATSDPAEAEADRMARSALSGGSTCTCAAGGPMCASCTAGKTIRRKPKASRAPAGTAGSVGLGSGRRLGDAERGFFEARMRTDFSAVRIHDDARAAEANDRIGARAFTLGNDIAFAHGEYLPQSASGRELLAHELAHVVQGDHETVRRQPPAQDEKEKEKKKEEPAKADPANPTVLPLTGTLEERVAAFKEFVKTTAVHRLIANKKNLSLWSLLVERAIPETDLAAIGLSQSGGSRAYFEMQEIRDPGVRELRAEQALGKFRACTGCHIENQLWGTKGERERESLTAWASPNDIRAKGQARLPGASTPFRAASGFGTADFDFSAKPMPKVYNPPVSTTEGKLNRLFPDPQATRDALKRIAPIVDALGPEGYKVLPASILGTLISGKPAEVRSSIVAAIVQRQNDFDELIKKIQAGDVGWEHFAPVIRSLLPIADAQVRAAIQKEMDDNAFWAKVEAVVVGILTAAALILTIFPPTSVLGVALLISLDLSLGYYGVTKGQQMIELGRTYGLATGADDVFTKEQQQSADTMVLMGFVSMAGGWLQTFGGVARLNSALAKLAPIGEATALATTSSTAAARVIQQGDYVITIANDGSMFITVASRPDLVIMARGNSATLYQLMEGGGMRALQTVTLPAPVATPMGAPLLLSAGSEAGAASTALVPVQQAAMVPTREAAAVPASLEAAADPARVLITPPPREPLLLGTGNATTFTWDQISRMRQPRLWQEREIYLQQLYGSPGQQHFPVPGTGGRYTDVPAQLPSGQLFAGEAKSYTRWITVEGQAQRNVVELTPRIQEQIRKDVWLRDNVPGYDPRWIFTDAPPTEAMRQALRDAGIVFIEYLK
jgi:hypothetical protein